MQNKRRSVGMQVFKKKDEMILNEKVALLPPFIANEVEKLFIQL
jgi:hypothetical protein